MNELKKKNNRNEKETKIIDEFQDIIYDNE